MPRNVILHVGLPKTATTTIQGYLRSKDDKLRSLGFLYPGPREHQILDLWVNHTLMLNAMVGRVNALSQGLDARACREVVALTFRKFRESDLATLIWSHEGIAVAARRWDVNYVKQILDGADVRIVFFARYADDWIESLYRESIWERVGPRAEMVLGEPLLPLAPPAATAGGSAPRPGRSMLDRAAGIVEALRLMRDILPSAEIVVRSFDANREKGATVSGALEAMGLPVDSAFPDADEEAGVRNPSKSDPYTMLLYQLIVAQAGSEVVREVAAAALGRENQGLEFEPLRGRRFRFLSDEDAARARGYYEELRQEYPDLPARPPEAPKPSERRLRKDDGVALLEWLRPDISDAVFDRACAAYGQGLSAAKF